MSFSAQAQTTNICDRTQQVRDDILSKTSAKDTCDSVLVSEMASIDNIELQGKRITALRPGDFDGLTQVTAIFLINNKLTELRAGIFAGLPNLLALQAQNNSLVTLSSRAFSNLPNLTQLQLHNNRLSALPAGIFSGLPKLSLLTLDNNRSSPFRFTVKFASSELTKNFTVASVRVVLREGAPMSITVPLSATGATLSVDSLKITTGSVRSNAVTVTRTPGGESFELSQGELRFSGGEFSSGFEIVRGPAVTTATFTHVRARVFLEGALE